MKTSLPLIITLGNPARGDDAVGEAVFQLLQNTPFINSAESLYVTQLQPEHIELLRDRIHVLIVDTAHEQTDLIELKQVKANFTGYVSSHIVPPDVLLGWYHKLIDAPAPSCYLLSLRGKQFELGAPISAEVYAALPSLVQQIEKWLEWVKNQQYEF